MRFAAPYTTNTYSAYIHRLPAHRLQEARSSFFQRQFCSALKLLRNILSWQGMLADEALKSMAISTLLNRNLMMAIRVSAGGTAATEANDGNLIAFGHV